MSWTVAVTVDGTPITADVLDSIQVAYGRQDTASTISATSCALSLVGADITPLVVGALLVVTLDVAPPGGAVTRFTGRITDTTVRKDTITVVAVSDLWTRLARTTISYTPTGPDTGTVVQTLAEIITTFEAAVGLTWAQSYATNAFYVFRVAATGTALTLLNTYALSDPGGVVYETQSGTFAWAGISSRTDPVSALTLTSDEVGYSWEASRRVDDTTNQAQVDWYAGTELYEDAGSVAAIGGYSSTLTTELSDAGTAQATARLIVEVGLLPSFTISPVSVSCHQMSDARHTALMGALNVGACITIPALFTGAPTLMFVEGYSETISRSSHNFDLYLSDAATGLQLPEAWSTVVPGLTWAATSPTLTWDDMWTAAL